MEKIPKIVHKKETEETKDFLLSNILQEAINIEVTKEYRDTEGYLLTSPNGPRSRLQNELHWKMVRTQSFKKWFGDWENDKENVGKIVDENGEPRLLYHASESVFKELKPDNSSHFKTSLGKGVYLAPDASMVEDYGNKFYSCFVNVKEVVSMKVEQGTKDMFRRLFYSFSRPKNTALSIGSDGLGSGYKKEIYGENHQYSVLHKENIIIVPSDIEHPIKTALIKKKSAT